MDSQQSQQDQLFLNRYRLGRNIGQGSQGQVKLALDTLSGQRVAIKIFKHRKMNSLDFEFLFREVNMLQQLQGHRAFLKLIDFVQNIIYINGHGQKEIISVIVMEYASNGSLFDLISFFQEKYNENIIKIIALQLIDAIEHMQKYKISHRDLKLENIVIDSNYDLKIIDFGLSIQETNECRPKANVGTTPYAPPERFLGKEYNGQKFDIFSLGVLLFVLKFNYYPFSHNNPEHSQECGSFFIFSENRQQFWQQILHNERIEDLSFLDMLNQMLQQDPQLRPSIQQLRLHPFLQQNNSSDSKCQKFFQMRKEIMNEMIKKQKIQKLNKIELDEGEKENKQIQNQQPKQQNQSILNESSKINQQPIIKKHINKHKNQQNSKQNFSNKCQKQTIISNSQNQSQKVACHQIKVAKFYKRYSPTKYQQKIFGKLIVKLYTSYLLKTSILDMKLEHTRIKNSNHKKNILEQTNQNVKNTLNIKNYLTHEIQQNRKNKILKNHQMNQQQMSLINNQQFVILKEFLMRNLTKNLVEIEKVNSDQQNKIKKQHNKINQFQLLIKIQQILIIYLFLLKKIHIKFNQILQVLTISIFYQNYTNILEQQQTHHTNIYAISI